MKIQFISNYSDLYGANRSLVTILRHLKRKGHEVKVLLPRKGNVIKELDKEDIEYSIIPYYSGFLYIKPQIKHILVPFLTLANILFFPFILRKIKNFDPDIIYSNSTLENFGLILSRLIGKKHIQHIREFMSLDYNSYFVFGNKAKQAFIERSDGVVYVTNAVRNHITRNYTSESFFKVIYNGIPIPSSLPERRSKSTNEMIIGLIGIFDQAKGQLLAVDYIFKVLNHYPNIQLHLFGDKDCNYKRKVEKLVTDLSLEDKVIFKGFVDDAKEIYKNIDILLMFSKSEGFGRVTVEAMSYGAPVIGFDSGGTSELIENKVSGCLFSNFYQFREALDFLNIDGNYKVLRENAYNVAKTKFNDKVYAQQVEDFILSVLKR